MPISETLEGGRVPVLAWTSDMEASARQQLANIAQLPIVHHHVAAMPDVHTGIGATVGSVIATHRAIIPAAVGVDIGCGMMATRLSLSANDFDEKSLRRVFDQISRDVPVGRGQHQGGKSPERGGPAFRTGAEADLRKASGRAQGLRQLRQLDLPDGHPGNGQPFHRALPR